MRRLLAADRSPRQWAGGVALGMMIGLVPKGNLVAFALGTTLLMVRVNLGAGLTTALCLSAVRPWVLALTHAIGLRLLTLPWAYHFVAWLYRWPVVPWSDLNQTTVVGGFALGVSLFYPVFHITERTILFCTPAVSRAVERLRRHRGSDDTGPNATENPVKRAA